jgi:hypothetical protein
LYLKNHHCVTPKNGHGYIIVGLRKLQSKIVPSGLNLHCLADDMHSKLRINFEYYMKSENNIQYNIYTLPTMSHVKGPISLKMLIFLFLKGFYFWCLDKKGIGVHWAKLINHPFLFCAWEISNLVNFIWKFKENTTLI